jgi:hypothetical protein
MAGRLGVVPQQPEDAALERELRHLYGTGAEIFVHGSRPAPPKHTGRILQLEQEDPGRFPAGPGPTACQPTRAPGPGRASRSGGNLRPAPSR